MRRRSKRQCNTPPPPHRVVWHLILATAVCGYKGYEISVYFLATAVCGYKVYQFQYTFYSHGGVWL
jgi:hypothetical protein